jgi:pimeloyl-ACP methyl ester carboxylesterase
MGALHVMTDLRARTLSVGPWDINTVVAGHGPPILFLHGLGGSWQWWQPTLTTLADEFTVCAIDLPGAGSSSLLTEPPEPSTYRELVDRIIGRLGRGPAIVVGHSVGGYVAVQAALQRAPGMRALALVAPAGFGPVRNIFLRLLSFPGVGECLMRLRGIGPGIFLRSLVYHRRAVSAEMLRWANASMARPGNREQFLQQLRFAVRLGRTSDRYIINHAPRLAMPVRLLWGEHDSVFPLESAYRAQRVLDPRLPVLFAQSGHLPQLEEPDRFHAELRSFAREA